MIWVKLRQYRSSLCSSIAQQGTDALANSVRPTYIFDRKLRILAVLSLVTVLTEPLAYLATLGAILLCYVYLTASSVNVAYTFSKTFWKIESAHAIF